MAQAIAEPQTGTPLAGFDEMVEGLLREWSVPGMAIVVVKDGEVIHRRGYGLRDVERNLPVTTDTIFAIGSSSKAFTTMALGLLADEGKLDWETPVKTYIPTFKLHDQFATDRMTPLDLVCHRSGMPRHDLMWYNSPRSRKEIFDRLQYLQPNKDFRSIWQYQNLMYLTAGYLVEVISGKTWEEFVKERIFLPLGMANSNLSVNDSQRAADFSLPYQEKDEQIEVMEFRNIDAVGPAGSINAPITDMTQWLLLHLGKGAVGEKRLIAEGQIARMHAPQMVMSASITGLRELPEMPQPSP
jgi:CubicO group peptidase (beta-lactamase class C family)